MGMHCDLHGIGRDLRLEVRVCGARSGTRRDEPFVMAELRVGDGCVNLFLTPDQAVDLAHGISSALQAADQDGEPAAEALPERDGA